jgi:hypothetical protein
MAGRVSQHPHRAGRLVCVLPITGKGWNIRMASPPASPQRVEPRAPRAGEGRPPDRPSLSDRLPQAWLFPLLVFAATWVLILATWTISDRIYGQSHSWTWHFMFKDAGWYMEVAQHGYPAHLLKPGFPASATAFFPLFPRLIRLASYLTAGHFLIAGLLVEIVAGAVSALLVWLVAARVRGRWTADRAVALYCFFPGAMTFGMLYSEPVTVALAAGVVLALLGRHWLIAGIIGALGTAEASILIVLAGVSGITALHAIWTRREWRSLIAPVLTPLGMLTFFAWIGHRYHDYAFWFQVEHNDWNVHVDWGARTVHILLWNMPAAFQYRFVFTLYFIMLLVIAAGVALMLAARLPLPVTLYGVFVLLTFLLSVANPRPRYILCSFPLFIGAAAKLPRILYWPVLIVSAAGLALLIGWWPHHVNGPAP